MDVLVGTGGGADDGEFDQVPRTDRRVRALRSAEALAVFAEVFLVEGVSVLVDAVGGGGESEDVVSLEN
jgi:hypothetical protein